MRSRCRVGSVRNKVERVDLQGRESLTPQFQTLARDTTTSPPPPHPLSLPASPPPLAIHHPITTHCVEHSLPKSLPSSAPAPSSRSGKQPPPLLLHPLPTPPSHLPPPKERRSATWPRARSLLGKSTLSSSVKDNPAEVMSKPSHDLSLPLHHHRPWPHWRRTQRPPSPSTVAAVS